MKSKNGALGAPAAGIIAAGDGSRLKESHPTLCKPMVPVAGFPLCHWVAQGLRRAGVTDVTVLLNSRGTPARRFLESSFPEITWRFIRRDTASSWESFRLVSRTLAERADDFVISTVDALIPPQEIVRFVSEVRGASDAALALTDFVDDEKPLWADLGPDGRVTALGDQARARAHVTAGLYYLTSPLARALPEAQAYRSLRQYLCSLISEGARVAGVALAKTLDIDRPQDIAAAENFLGARSEW